MLESLRKINVDYIVSRIRRIIKDFPVEILTCLTAYVLVFFDTMNTQTLLMPVVFAAAYAVNNFSRNGIVPKIVYYATVLLLVLVFIVDAKDFVNSSSYGFSLLLSAMLLVLSDKGASDGEVSLTFIKVAKSAVIAPAIFLALTISVNVIFYSVKYIFGIDGGDILIERIMQFLFIVVMPCTFLVSVRAAEEYDIIKTKFADILCNYIVGTAIIIYAAVLYVYMAKIAITVTLPLGGLSVMITAFYIVTFLWLMLQEKIDNKYYRWLYRSFGYISLPVIVMFFIGLVYRINEYGITESRAYMAVAGVEMVIGSSVLIFARKNRFKIILYTSAALIVLSTYIPYISAKDFGIRSQTERLIPMAQKAGAYDEKTGKLKYLKSVDEDHADAYEQMTSAYKYLQWYKSDEYMEKKYGKINMAIPDEMSDYSYVNFEYSQYVNHYPDLGEYHYLVTDDCNVDIEDGQITATVGDSTVIDTKFNIPEGLPTEENFIYKNDNYMLVINNFSRSKYKGEPGLRYSTYSYKLFKKSNNKIITTDDE